MRNLSIITLTFILLTNNVYGQNDKKAISILDKLSTTALSAPSVSMNFLLIKVDQIQNSIDSLAGSVILSKNSYKLSLPDNIIWFNGETSWSYLPAEEEVTITKPDKKDNSFQSRPASIFTMYKSGYKCRLIEERSDSYVIDLYPEDIKNELIRVRLTVAKPAINLKNFEYKRRDGTTVTILITDYNLTQVPDPGLFNFAPEKYKGVDVIDMR
jgi:outer membrane lipoprotein-sorting protein